MGVQRLPHVNKNILLDFFSFIQIDCGSTMPLSALTSTRNYRLWLRSLNLHKVLFAQWTLTKFTNPQRP